MTPDHYATLGVAPTSEDVVIRAAYLALMRRYHPDRNPSPEAAARVRAITAAYAVLGDWDRRTEYDSTRTHVRATETAGYAPRTKRRASPTALFAAASMALLLLVVAWPQLSVSERPDRLADRLADPPLRQAATATADPGADCSSQSTRDLVKRELFRRAAELRGSDSAPFERLARHALIRIDSSSLDDAGPSPAGTVRCRASVALDLPPGVAVTGGRRSLAAEIGYALKTAKGGGGSVSLSDEGLIVAPLATLAQIRPPAIALAEPSPEQDDGPVAEIADMRPAAARQRAAPAPQPPVRVAPARVAAARAAPERAAPEQAVAAASPSFSCRYAKGRGETAVCNNANLAKLDRHLAVLYGQTWGQGDAAKRKQLLGTREGFLARRDACRSDGCIRNAYLERMREVGDIMAAN